MNGQCCHYFSDHTAAFIGLKQGIRNWAAAASKQDRPNTRAHLAIPFQIFYTFSICKREYLLHTDPQTETAFVLNTRCPIGLETICALPGYHGGGKSQISTTEEPIVVVSRLVLFEDF